MTGLTLCRRSLWKKGLIFRESINFLPAPLSSTKEGWWWVLAWTISSNFRKDKGWWHEIGSIIKWPYIKQYYKLTFGAFVSQSDIIIFLSNTEFKLLYCLVFLKHGLWWNANKSEVTIIRTKTQQSICKYLSSKLSKAFTLFCGVFKARGEMLVLFCGA